MTQKQAITDLFKKGKTLSILTCFKQTGSMKLSARCWDMEQLGYIFKKEIVHFKTKYKTKGYYFNYTLDFKKTPKKLLK